MNDEMSARSDQHPAGAPKTGERAPAGEGQGASARFSLGDVARAFAVEDARVERAFRGEFNLGPEATVDSRGAQQLSEVLLGDQPMDRREAALMTLGAFTPRADDAWGLGDTAPGEQGHRLAASATRPEDELASESASYDPSQPHG